MADKSIQDRLIDVIVDELKVEKSAVTLEASFVDDLGADSLAIVELIMTLEEKFKDEIKGGNPEASGEIPEADAEKLKTVGDVLAYITEKATAGTRK